MSRSAVTIADVEELDDKAIFDLEGAYKMHTRKVCVVDSSRQGVFHPSAGGMCGRMNVYEFVRAPQEPSLPPELSDIYEMGHRVHDMIQDRMETMNDSLNKVEFEFLREVKCPDDCDLLLTFGIGGTTDGLLRIWTKDWEQRAVLEIKSINTDDFTKLTGPKRIHEWQAHIYAMRFDCPIIYYWYFNKNNSKVAVYARKFDPLIFQEALDKYIEWLRHVDAGTLPDREESWLDCRSCAYRKICDPAVLKSKHKRASSRMSKNRKLKLGEP